MKNIKKKSMLLLLPLAFLALTGCDGNNSSDSTAGGSQGNSDTSAIESEFAVTIEAVENGTVTANKTKAKVGEDVEFTVTVNEGYYVKSFLVNDVEVALTENKATVEMVDGGLKAKLIVTDSYPVSTIDEAFENKVKGLDNFKYAFDKDMSVEKLPLAKTETTIDLGGNTITFTGDEFIHSLQNDKKENVQKITLKNGSVKINSEKNVNNFINATNAKKFTIDGVKVETETSIYTGIYCSSSTDLSILNSTFDLDAIFVVGTNNLEGNNAGILIDNSTLVAKSDNKDNAAINVNTAGSSVTIKNSSLMGDRQAVIARTGTWAIENSVLTTTGAWLEKSPESVKTDNTYLAGTWKNGNEVPSAALVIGDSVDNAYNENVVLTAKNTAFIAQKGLKVVTRRDTKYSTTVTMDSLTYKNAKDGLDNGKGVSLSLSDNGETLTDLTATVEAGEGGTASLSKTTGITYGEKIDVTVAANTGYKVNKVTLVGIDGAETDITAAMSFNAGLKNTVKVEFAVKETGETTITATELIVPTEGTTITSQNKLDVEDVKGFSFSFSRVCLFYVSNADVPYDPPYLKIMSTNTFVIKNIDGKKIKKIDIQFTAVGSAYGGPLSVQSYSGNDKTNHNNLYSSSADSAIGVWESPTGENEAKFHVSGSGATIAIFTITCA